MLKSPFSKISLQRKLILAFALVLLIPAAAISIYTTGLASDAVVERAQTEKLRNIEANATKVEELLLTAQRSLLFVSGTATTRHYLDSLVPTAVDTLPTTPIDPSSPIVLFFDSFLKGSGFRSISVLSLDGQELMHLDASPVGEVHVYSPTELTNVSKAAFFAPALGLPIGQVYTSGLDLSRTSGQIDQPYAPIIDFATILTSTDGKKVGMLVLRSDARPILESAISTTPDEITYVLNAKDGSYLRSPDPTKLYGQLLGKHDTLNQDLVTDSGIILNQGKDEGVLFGSKDRPDLMQTFKRITPASEANITWVVLYQFPIAKVFENVTNARLIVLGLTVGALVVAVLTAIIVTRSITLPIEHLATAATEISQGKWNTSIPVVRSKDEIGALASAFATMSRELGSLYADMENRVVLRTAELQHANKNLEEARRKTEEISKAKSVFLSNMSHELRTPLNVVIGYSSSMLTMPQMYNNMVLPELFSKDIQLIKDSGNYLLGLINDILDLSKIESGKLDLRPTSVDLVDVCRGVVSTSIGLINNKPIQIISRIPDDIPLVWCDPTRVRQIILNLMANAVKFTNSGSITLAASIQGKDIRISVTDTGIGIPEEALATIFDRFEQVSHDGTKQYGGTGLGLDISKRLAQMHGSDLHVESTLGRGSSFWFTLPIDEKPQEITGTTPAESNPESNIEIFTNTPASVIGLHSILLAAEDTGDHDALRRILEGEGYVVINVHDGAEVLDLATALLPSLIILDVDLPHINGWDILKSLKHEPDTRAIPVVIHDGDANPSRAIELGAALHVKKTVLPEQILNDIKRLLAVEEKGI